ncbi:MAG TPA: D-alanyl-D-alanine carboxypeptidase family protein [Solirubrobacteraceae bacterium]|nr:D-alanyl-D-alanine carboxypeptidase family protein [Solirubrobacteraceae bacterium]
MSLAVLLALLLVAAPAGAAQRETAQKATIPAAPSLPVTGASLIAAGSDTPLWSSNGNAELPIASTTKLMTALVVLQHVKNLNTVFAQADWSPAPVDSQIGLIPGERMTVHDLLVALLLPSADDAAEDLAYNVGGGSVTRFVAMMNADARALDLDHTHYSTPIGLDTPGNYSSPDDLVRLGDYMMRNWPFFRATVGLASATLTSGRYERHVVNTDDLVGKVPWINGIKTGHTTDAGYVLVSQGTRGGLTLIASVLGTTSEYERDKSALALLDWGFSAFKVVRPVRAGEAFARPKVPYEVAPALVVAKRGYETVVARDTRVKVVVGKLRKLSGPMAKGKVVGQLKVLVPGRPAVRIPLILARRLPAVSSLKKVGHLIKRPFTLLVLALLIGGAAVAVAERRRRPRVLATGHLEER